MTRVSLKEAYDNKDVVAQIYAIRDIAEGAEDTANNAVSTANTASEHVDALVPQVEGAVQNANNASASAQTSAQTVAGYENRLSDVELKVTTAEGDIITIQGRITALETADGQDVKLSGNQNITGIKTVPTEATGTRSQQIANSAKVGADLDNYAPMVRTTGNQVIAGVKQFSYNVESLAGIKGGESPEAYTSNYGRFRVTGSDNLPIVGLGFEKGSGVVRLVFNINGSKDPDTQQQPVIQIHFIMNEVEGTLKLQPAYVNKNGTRVFGTEQTLMTWTP